MKNGFEIGFSVRPDPSLGRSIKIDKKIIQTFPKDKTPKPSQAIVVEELSDKNFCIIKAPTGWGKSLIIQVLIKIELQNYLNRKVIVSVPQIIIGKSFSYNNGIPCTVEELINFIEDPVVPELNSRVILCTHAALVMAWDKIKNKKLFANTTICADEIHHAKNAEIELEEDVYDPNKLGAIIYYALSHKELNFWIKGATATYFRGDGCYIIPEKFKKEFTTAFVPYDEYLAELKYLKLIEYKTVFFSGSYIDAIKNLKQVYGEHIVAYIPRSNSRYAINNKYDDAKAIIAAIAKGKDYINCVDDTFQARREAKARLSKEDLAVFLIVFLAMGKEGFDYPKADTALVVGQRNLNESIQIFGRLFRDYLNKTKVTLFNFVEFSIQDLDGEETKENVNNLLKALYASMAVEDLIQPVKIKISSSDEGKTGGKEKSFNEFANAFPDPDDRNEFRKAVWTDLQIACGSDGFDVSDINLIRDCFDEIVYSKLDELKWDDTEIENCDYKGVADQIWNHICQRRLVQRGYDVSKIDIDLINSVNPVEYFIEYASAFGIDTCVKLREIINSRSTIKYTNEYIKSQIDKFEKINGTFPITNSGKTPDGLTTFSAIDLAMAKCQKGVEQSNTLAKFIENNYISFGTKKYSFRYIKSQLDEFKKINNKFPSYSNSKEKTPDGKTTFYSIQCALIFSGSSLKKFITENYEYEEDYKNSENVKYIIRQIDEFKLLNNKFPSGSSGKTPDGKITFAGINRRIKKIFSLTLTQFIKNNYFDYKQRRRHTDYTNEYIKSKIDEFKKANGKFPRKIDKTLDGISFCAINAVLVKRSSTLMQFIKYNYVT